MENICDEVPYSRSSYMEAHPDRMCTIARLCGLDAPPPEGCQVLELGCARGGNLLPMACALPGSRFLGIELSARQVDEAQEHIQRLGLQNVEVRQMDILDLPDKGEEFDYIIAHGVYSWVPPAVRQKMFRLAASRLAERGVAYFSYNTLPGCYPASIVREVVLSALPGVRAHDERIKKARKFLAALRGLLQKEDGPYQDLLGAHLDSLLDVSDVHLLHDNLATVSDPVYFHQFAEQAEQAGLQYLGDAEPFDSLEILDSADVKRQLADLNSDTIFQIQMVDVLTSRKFRRSLLCHRGVNVGPGLSKENLKGLLISSNCQPESAQPDLLSCNPERFAAPSGRVSSDNPVVKLGLSQLAEAWPLSLAYEQLCERVEQKLKDSTEAIPSGDEDVHSTLSSMILDAFRRSRILGIHTCQPGIEKRLTEKPTVFAVARLQATLGSRVTNLWHQSVDIGDPLSLRITSLLDGRSDRSSLIRTLLEDHRKGALSLQVDGRSVSDVRLFETLLSQHLEQVLQRLSSSALLVP